eukprot:gene6632-biopygen11391
MSLCPVRGGTVPAAEPAAGGRWLEGLLESEKSTGQEIPQHQLWATARDHARSVPVGAYLDGHTGELLSNCGTPFELRVELLSLIGEAEAAGDAAPAAVQLRDAAQLAAPYGTPDHTAAWL